MGNESNDLIKRDIYKAHQAIAVAPSPGSRINLLTRRFFNVLLQHAQRQGNVETFRAPLSAILNDANYSSQNFEVAKAVLRGLAKTTVEWSVVNDESEKTNVGRRWGISSLLAQAELIDDGSSIHFEWSYAPAIRNSMLDPSRYVQLDMAVFASLRTGTAASLYEICTRYLTNFGGLTNKETWEWWRPRLTGVPDDGTPTEGGYKFFKRDRLMPAINEINELSNITVELHEFRTGRRITHIQFSSKEKSQASLGLESIENDGVVERLCDIGFTEPAAAKLYAANESDVLAATLAYVEMRVKKAAPSPPWPSPAMPFAKATVLRKAPRHWPRPKLRARRPPARPPARHQAENRPWILPRPPNAHASTLMPCLRMTSRMSFASSPVPWLKGQWCWGISSAPA